MTAAEQRERQPRRVVFWTLAVLLASGLLAALLLTIWIGDDSDLREQERLAAKAGMAVDWAGLGEPLLSGAHKMAWDEIARMDDREVVSFQSSEMPSGWDEEQQGAWDPFDLGNLGEPVPEQVGYWHREALDQEAVNRYLALVDDLGEEPFIVSPVRSSLSSLEDIAVRQRISRFLGERILVARTSEELTESIERFWRFQLSNDQARALIDHLVAISQASFGIQCISQRAAWNETSLTFLRRWLATSRMRQARAWNGEWLWAHGTVGDPQAMEDLISDIPWFFRVPWKLAQRYDRANVLIANRRMWEAAQLDDRDAIKAAEAMDTWLQGFRGSWNRYLHLLINMLGPGMSGAQNSLIGLRLHAKALLALHANDPWPLDPWDPAAGELRKIFDGKDLVGAYSIGDDGVDDGWQLEKHVFWLVRELRP